MELSNITGMETGQEFMVKPGSNDWAKDPLFNHVFKSEITDGGERFKMRPTNGEIWAWADADIAYEIIAHSPASIVPMRVYLTRNQKRYFEACIVLGLYWLAKDKDGSVNVFGTKPVKSADRWHLNYSNGNTLRVVNVGYVNQLVRWMDNTPLSILDVLKENREVNQEGGQK